MICKHCGGENNQKYKFCTKCGKELVKEVVKVSSDVESIKTDVQTKIFRYKAGENAYAIFKEKEDGNHFFLCIDNISGFYCNEKTRKEIYPSIKNGDGVWVNLNESINSKKNIFKVKSINGDITEELKSFIKYHNEGDIIKAPVIEITQKYITVSLGPSASNRIYKTTQEKFETIKKGDIIQLTIKSISRGDNKKINIVLEVNYNDLEKENLWNQLPANLMGNNVVIPENNVAKFNNEENQIWINELFNNKTPTVEKLRRVLNGKYRDAYEKKQINIKETAKAIYIDFDLGIKNKKGVPQSAYFKKKGNSAWVFTSIDFSSAECVFERYVYIPDWKSLLSTLAEMALGNEDWDYNNKKEKNNYILKQYLLFNYYKSWLDGLIIEENNGAIFDTGLVDSSYDNIYCYLKENTNKNDFYQRKWEFGYFACRGKSSNGKRINAMFSQFPKVPTYVDTNNIHNLYFDTSKDLSNDYSHIIEDNLHRLPLEFIRHKLSYNGEIMSLVNQYEKSKTTSDWNKLQEKITQKDESGQKCIRDLQNGLKDAVETAIKYCKWNYKTAIPIYYPRNNSISLLLPLNLQSENKTDVALVIERLPNGNYQGQTILTLQMAYQDARQICRPNSDWLQITDISEDEEADKEDM